MRQRRVQEKSSMKGVWKNLEVHEIIMEMELSWSILAKKNSHRENIQNLRVIVDIGTGWSPLRTLQGSLSCRIILVEDQLASIVVRR